MLTRRIFLRGSAIAMAGMGQAPLWLARAAATEGRKRKTLVVIFLRGAADGLNIVVPFADPRYRELRPVLGLQPPRRGDDNNGGPFGSVIDLDGKFEVGAEGYVSRSQNSCFYGRTLHGRVLVTVAAGAVAFRARLLTEAGAVAS